MFGQTRLARLDTGIVTFSKNLAMSPNVAKKAEGNTEKGLNFCIWAHADPLIDERSFRASNTHCQVHICLPEKTIRDKGVTSPRANDGIKKPRANEWINLEYSAVLQQKAFSSVVEYCHAGGPVLIPRRCT